MHLPLTLIALLLNFSAYSKGHDKKDFLHGVRLKSYKSKDVRGYLGKTEKLLPFSLTAVLASVTNFSDKCNNSYRDRRRYTSTDKNCSHHNEHLIETFREELPKTYSGNFSDAFLLGRQVYNRSSFSYYELVTVTHLKNEKGQNVVQIDLRMLDDKETKALTKPLFSRESIFNHSSSSYTLTQISPQETHLSYEYTADTDHWLLNKEVTVPQVFVSISKSINDLMNSIEAGSRLQNRELASKK